MKRVVVKGRPGQLHPWIYSKRIVDAGDAEPGDAVAVYNTRGQFLGSYLFNPRSVLALRRYSLKEEPLDYLAIKERLFRALEYRQFLFRRTRETAYRWVHSEADGLPGLVVDRYERGVVFQINALGMERRRGDLLKALEDLLEPEFIVEKSDTAGRREEGLEPREGVVRGEVPEPLVITVAGMRYRVDLLGGNKTGFFLDQRENRRVMEAWARGRALDLFAYTGGFTLHLLRGGARQVYAVEGNPANADLIRVNAELNGLDPGRVVVFRKNVFDFVEEMLLAGEQFDVIVLDPPAFTHRRGARSGALKGYRMLHDRVIRLLRPQGLVATFSCATHVSDQDLLESFQRAAESLKRPFRVVHQFQQAPDHPVLLGFPESRYLKGWLFQAL